MGVFICKNGNCGHRTFGTFRSFCFHIRTIHIDDPTLSISCGIDNCQNRFKLYHSYRRHCLRCHKESTSDNCFDTDSTNFETNELESSGLDNDSFVEEGNAVIEPLLNTNEFIKKIQSVLAVFSLRVREMHCVPAVVHTDIMNSIAEVIRVIMEQVLKTVVSEFGNRGIHIDEVFEVFQLDLMVDAMFTFSRSDFMLKKFCREFLTFKEPTEYVINGSAKVYIVPIFEQLKTLLSKEDVLQEVLQNNTTVDNPHMLCDFKSGVLFKNSEQYNKSTIFLNMYNDEFEVVNPIGTKRGKQKLNAVYFTIGNFSVNHHSKLKYIFLAMLTRHKFVTQHGYDAVFSPLVKDLAALEESGIIVTSNSGVKHKFEVRVATLSGDNLSSHAIGGFRQCFSSGRICRFCMITHDAISSVTSEKDVILRNIANHSYHVTAAQMSADNVSAYGVAGNSVLSQLKNFNPVTCLPPDPMHDLLEGVVPAFISALLQELSHKGLCRLRDLNNSIENFRYKGSDLKNKPQAFKSGFEIVGSASQKWCLLRLLPLLCPLAQDEELFSMYVKLRVIVDHLLAPKIPTASVAYLETHISEFLGAVQVVLPCLHLTPKFHFLIHYPRALTMFGPLRNLWCMRFEAKHQYFKSVVNHLRNFINVSKTLCTRHCMLQAYNLSGNNFFGSDTDLQAVVKPISRTKLPSEILDAICTSEGTLSTVASVSCHNVLYTKGTFITLGKTADGVPIFFEICTIFILTDSHVDIAGKVYNTSKFCSTAFGYVIKNDTWCVIHPGEECDSTELMMYIVNDEKVIIPHHYVY